MKAINSPPAESDDRRNEMKAFAARFPLLFASATTLAAMLCLLWPLLVPGFSQTVQILMGRVTICLLAVYMLTNLGWWRETGFVRPASWRILVPYLPIILFMVAIKTFDVVTGGIHVFDPGLILLGLVVYLAGGFMEEAIFRGLLLRTFLPGGLVRAAFLSALLFALAHLLNLLMGANLGATILQIAVAFLAGLAFAAPLAVTRNIWPLVIIHGFGNFVGYLNAGGFLNTGGTSKGPSWVDVVLSLVPYLLLGVYSFWLLRRAARQTHTLPFSQPAASLAQVSPTRIGQK
jgi:membrane protease YdiL (CAAX protease family)